MDVYEAMAARKTIRDFALLEISPEMIKRSSGAVWKT